MWLTRARSRPDGPQLILSECGFGYYLAEYGSSKPAIRRCPYELMKQDIA